MIIHSTPQTAPKTQTAPSGGPPRPPKKTARGLQDEPGEPAKEGDSKLEMSMVVTNAQMTWSELLVLNGGGRPLKREELETSLDRSILALSRLAGRMKKAKSVFENWKESEVCVRKWASSPRPSPPEEERERIFQTRAKKEDLKTVMDILRSIRDYRLRFPRANAANHELSEQAQQVLDEHGVTDHRPTDFQ